MNRYSRRLATATAALFLAAAALPCAPVVAQAARSGNPLQPFAYLVGSCWRGTFPGRSVTDEHCFEWLHEGRFLRDRHVVRGDSVPYSGETTYAWDAKTNTIVYWYIASHGSYSTGTAEVEDDAIVFPETNVSGGRTREFKNVWRRTGANTFHIRVLEKTGVGMKELWSMEMVRTR